MEITVSAPDRPDRRVAVFDPALAAHVVALVNSLPVTQHSSYSCPYGIAGHGPEHPAITVVFRPGPRAWPLAQIHQTLPVSRGCRPLDFVLRGRSERSLDEGSVVLHALHRLIARAKSAHGEGEDG
jgi:hypothetical protein